MLTSNLSMTTMGFFVHKGNVWNADKYCSWTEWAKGEVLEKHGPESVICPVYSKEEEKGVSITPANPPWKSIQVGWIFIPFETYQSKGLTFNEARSIIENEVFMIDKYLKGEVGGIVLYSFSPNGEAEEIKV